MADFRFSRWRPSDILDLFYACWDHPRRVFGGLCDSAKFGCIRRSNFDSMQILIFCTFKLENAYSRPQNRGFGGVYPQDGEQYEWDPKRRILERKRRMTYRSSKSVNGCGLSSSRRIRQNFFKKVYLRNHNTCFFHVFAQTTHAFAVPHGFACVGIPATWLFQVSSKSVQRFRSPRGSKFNLSHYFGYSLLQQLVLLYKPWYKPAAEPLTGNWQPDRALTVRKASVHLVA